MGGAWCRASNTQPVLVLRFEALTEKRLQEIKEFVEDKVRHFLPSPGGKEGVKLLVGG